jgi:hypothetical protein
VTPPSQAERGGPAEVLYVLCLMQAGFLLLAGFGETILMGNGLYLVVPVAKATVVLVIAAKAASRRWALIGLIVVQGITLLGFWVQVSVGLTPWVDFTVNLAVLITNVALPAGLIYLAARLLRPRPRVVAFRVRRDPYAPAPLVTPPPPASVREVSR